MAKTYPNPIPHAVDADAGKLRGVFDRHGTGLKVDGVAFAHFSSSFCSLALTVPEATPEPDEPKKDRSRVLDFPKIVGKGY